MHELLKALNNFYSKLKFTYGIETSVHILCIVKVIVQTELKASSTDNQVVQVDI